MSAFSVIIRMSIGPLLVQNSLIIRAELLGGSSRDGIESIIWGFFARSSCGEIQSLPSFLKRYSFNSVVMEVCVFILNTGI
jgi:hypothetical protein